MEIWEDIEEYEGLYQVSDHRRVKSLERVITRSNGSKQTIPERILKPCKDKDGYHRVILCKNLKKKNYAVCRLVAKAFIPNPENKPQVNHINGIKDDDRAENLEWCTVSENIKQAFETGVKCQKGDNNNYAKLNKYNVQHIRGMYAEGTHTHQQLADMFGVDRVHITKIINRKTWADIPDL